MTTSAEDEPGKVVVSYVFGNGLSVAFSSAYYSLSALTRQLTDRLGEMSLPDGESLLEELEAVSSVVQARTRPRDFEEIAGPIDALANAFSEIGPLLRLADTREQRTALTALGRKLRRLYVRAVGAVLEVVVDHSAARGDWARVNVVAEDVVRQAREARAEVDVFVLNYDALLDSALLEAIKRYKGVGLHDEFYGGETWNVTVLGHNGRPVQVPAHPWRRVSYRPSSPQVSLHHLHGAGTWLLADGNVFKAKRLERLRELRVFGSWAEGLEDASGRTWAEPSVLLGNQKERMAARWPFSEAYQAFASSVASTDELVLAGYSFRDSQLNRAIVQNRRPGCRVVVINPSRDLEPVVRRELKLTTGDPDLMMVPHRLPIGLARWRDRR